MTQTVCLADWVDEKIGRRDKPFSSNYAFAEHVGVSEHTVRKLRKMGKPGKYEDYRPNIETLRKIAEAFPETSISELSRMAGFPMDDDEVDHNEAVKRLARAASRLTPENQRLVQRLIDTLLAEQRAEEQDEG